MKLIDLSFPIREHWRWGFQLTLKHRLEDGDAFRSTVMTLPSHCYTHVDTLLHCKPGGAPALDELPVDAWSGKASVLDLTPVIRQDHAISRDDILKALPATHEKGDILLLKTCWETQRDISSKEYWTDAPYVTQEAARALLELAPRAVGFDFPQDVILKEAATRKGCLPMDGSTTHQELLLKGVFLIEYLCNLGALTRPRIDLLALPLRVVGGEGSPVRAVAVESL